MKMKRNSLNFMTLEEDQSCWCLSFQAEALMLCFRSSISAYREGCVNVSILECDLTSFGISVYGNYVGRVRVLLGSESSAWVESNHIMPDKDSKPVHLVHPRVMSPQISCNSLLLALS